MTLRLYLLDWLFYDRREKKKEKKRLKKKDFDLLCGGPALYITIFLMLIDCLFFQQNVYFFSIFQGIHVKLLSCDCHIFFYSPFLKTIFFSFSFATSFVPHELSRITASGFQINLPSFEVSSH